MTVLEKAQDLLRDFQERKVTVSEYCLAIALIEYIDHVTEEAKMAKLYQRVKATEERQ